jgi:hypothetical protein
MQECKLLSAPRNKYVFIIEVKTNVGWHRINENTKSGIEAIESIRTRCNDLAGKFEVDKQKIMYIFEEPSNVSKNFTVKIWDEDQLKPNPRPPNLPFSIIYPLFYKIDPYYWTWEKGFDPRKNYKEISDEQIQKMAKNSIVTPFEEILRIILKS